MVSLVLVSHCRALALALRGMLETLYGDKTPCIAVAAGAGADGKELGTDATAIMDAVEEAAEGADGVLVLLDLGSAIMSEEMALELLDKPLRGRVSLCSAPLLEGAIAAAAQCSVGATLAEVRAEAEDALRQKIEHLGPVSITAPAMPSAADPAETSATTTLRVENPHGLHARPAMRIVQTVANFSSVVNCLDARPGDTIRICGEAAADPLAAELFIGLGVQELSVGVAAARTVRTTLETAGYQQNRSKARRCLKASSGGEVRRLWHG